jgi:hypothetical protein
VLRISVLVLMGVIKKTTAAAKAKENPNDD